MGPINRVNPLTYHILIALIASIPVRSNYCFVFGFVAVPDRFLHVSSIFRPLADGTITETRKQTLKAHQGEIFSGVPTEDTTNGDQSSQIGVETLVDNQPPITNGKARNEKLTQEDLYWRVEGDPWRIEHDFNRTTLIFKIRGNPLPLRRHRTSRGFIYNPSASAQAAFSNLVKELIWSNDVQSDSKDKPLFGDQDQLSLSVVFCMKRPLNHFISSKRGEGRLKESTRNRIGSIRTDVDNLAKFILDSLNGMVYVDDKQVASIHATKCYDSEGLCQGSTLVCIRNLQESDLVGLLDIKL